MKINALKNSLALVGGALLLSTAAVQAEIPIYSPPGTPNTDSGYTWTEPEAGTITVYFVGLSADYHSWIGVSIGGAAPDTWVLHNQSSQAGNSAPLANVPANTAYSFILAVYVSDPGQNVVPPVDANYELSTDRTANGGVQHAWSTDYEGGDYGIPAGTYIGFEDISPLPTSTGEPDYNDHQFVFVFSPLGRETGVPEGGASLALLGLLLAGAGAVRRRMK